MHVSPYVPDMHLSAGSCPQVNDVNVTGDRAAAAAELLRKGKNNTDFADAGRCVGCRPRGRRTRRFGLRGCCSLVAGRSFLHEGARYITEEVVKSVLVA
ncbi:hypothetical protein CHLRE_01g022681v5 [Chlamydomonas reinhardtii]|uniref:Uncharacterized protein n=1 Tax=Chlamydomonas reinhardtii TaxID=3055 RepID=A0A2K3E686_CHLRE|nr:uncharacterized protein CHLRE_01g022681v5 [Chlamydomonas reinhardtii]PNW88286.1 hypothetical protein CHLRE_01g022681v5 [Chlamydomonas reinhardtii]